MNSTIDKVKLHVLHEAEKYEEIKHSFINMNADQRGQEMLHILSTVKQALMLTVRGVSVFF